MKKQRMCLMLSSLALVGMIGIGSTQAYFSDASNEVTNTFTWGKNISITLRENKVNENGTRVENQYFTDSEVNNEDIKGLDYKMVINVDYSKNPHVVLDDNSNDAYVYMYVSGLDELLTTDIDNDRNSRDFYLKGINDKNGNGINDSWKKIVNKDGTTSDDNSLDGIYVYEGPNTKELKMEAGSQTESLFDIIGINESVKNVPKNLSVPNIIVKAAGVQTTNPDHQKQAIDLLIDRANTGNK